MPGRLRIGFVINPYAGLGGPLAHKGSDNAQLAVRALENQWALSALTRAMVFLKTLAAQVPLDITWLSPDGSMGGDCLERAGFDYVAIAFVPSSPTNASDTQRVCQFIAASGVDLMVFVGGDGTARDVLSALPKGQLALGVPAGVKMQSGVYAITPQSAAELIVQMARGALIGVADKEVRDIDEQAFRKGVVKSQYYGDMTTLNAAEYVQHVKQGGLEVEALVLLDIAEHLKSSLPDNALIIVGPGSTTYEVLKGWGISSTLLGVDVLNDWRCIAADADADTLNQVVDKHTQGKQSGPVFIVLSVIGGQGHIIGRGNQQISVPLLERVGRDNIRIIATKTKLKTLEGRPLLMDSGKPELDNQWQGYMPVITGFEDQVMYPLGFAYSMPKAVLGADADDYQVLLEAAKEYCCSNNKDIRRLVHGRGGCFKGLEQITLDAFDECFLLTVFKTPGENFDQCLAALHHLVGGQYQHKLIVQRRDLPGTAFRCYDRGPVPAEVWVSQAGLEYQLRFSAQNTGFFLDMESARHWLKGRVKGRRVLNLFSYTCAFSVVAMAHGAAQCTNVDMSSSALSWGRENHRRNNIATENVQFLALNILKSWSRIKKHGPYDIIIIDPPSFQKGSFVASRDYAKLAKRIAQLAAPKADVLACLNAPELGPEFLRGVFAQHWLEGVFVQRLELTEVFTDVDPSKQLKVMHFSTEVA